MIMIKCLKSWSFVGCRLLSSFIILLIEIDFSNSIHSVRDMSLKHMASLLCHAFHNSISISTSFLKNIIHSKLLDSFWNSGIL